MLTKQFNFKNRNCKYFQTGKGKLFLFLHGGGARADMYSPLIEKLSQDFHEIVRFYQ